MKTMIYGSLLTLFVATSATNELAWAQAEQAAQQDSPQPGRQDDTNRVRRLQDSLQTDQEWVPGQADNSRRLQRKLSLAERALAAGNLTAPPQSSALKYYRDALEIDPNNSAATAGLDRIAGQLVERARTMNNVGDRAGAEEFLTLARQINPELPALAIADAEMSQQAEIEQGLSDALTAFDAGQLDQALGLYRAVAVIDSENNRALSGIAAVTDARIARASEAIEEGDFELAEQELAKAAAVDSDNSAIADARAEILQIQEQEAMAALQQAAQQALATGDLDTAEARLSEYEQAGGTDTTDLQTELARLRRLARYPVGSRFSDDPTAPEMVVMPSGSFAMGSTTSEAGRYGNEGPVIEVELSEPFGLSRHEVTVAQFREFVSATEYVTDAERVGESSVYDLRRGELTKREGVSWRLDYAGDDAEDNLPVVHVSYNDALAYATWLAEETGERYRLPSEAEFEYALRAGSTAPYWWGRTPPDRVENLAGAEDSKRDWNWGDQGFPGYRDSEWGPSEVGSFAANPFGLHDIGGNVMEWTADCYVNSLDQVPDDGTRVSDDSCDRNVLKGASWASSPRRSRSAQRTPAGSTQASCLVGFRVARDL